jgi:hypothetical protein
MKYYLLLFLFFLPILVKAQDSIIGTSGIIHVTKDPDSIGLVMIQDSQYNALLAWDFKNKVLYGYHPDSLVGKKWNPVATGVQGVGGKDTLWIHNATDSAYVLKKLSFGSSQGIIKHSIVGINGRVSVITNLNFKYIDPEQADSLSIRLMEESRTIFRDSLFQNLVFSAANQTGAFTDISFDLPPDAELSKLTVIRGGYHATAPFDYTVSNNASGQRRRIMWFIPLYQENIYFKKHK